MTIKQAIERSIDGGWRPESVDHTTENNFVCYQAMVLDPKFWQALGKVEGWDERKECFNCKGTAFIHTKVLGDVPCDTCEDGLFPLNDWKKRMCRMTAALTEGKTIEQYLETL